MEVARIASLAGTTDTAQVLARDHASDRAPQAPGDLFPARTKENSNMKKLSHFTMLLAALLALTSFALAQQKTPPQGQGDQDKLVGIVRNATTQYVDDVKAATGAGYGP